MTYTYRCTRCGQIVEITCSISEKEERERELTCPGCGAKDFRRIFNAWVMTKKETAPAATASSGSA